MLCTICQKKLKNRRGFSNHLTSCHTFENDLEKERFLVYCLFGQNVVDETVLDYKNEKYCCGDLPIDIVKYLKLLGLTRSSKEERATSRYKQKYISFIQNKYGENITSISQVKSIQLKKQEKAIEKYGSYENYLAQCRVRRIQVICWN